LYSDITSIPTIAGIEKLIRRLPIFSWPSLAVLSKFNLLRVARAAKGVVTAEVVQDNLSVVYSIAARQREGESMDAEDDEGQMRGLRRVEDR